MDPEEGTVAKFHTNTMMCCPAESTFASVLCPPEPEVSTLKLNELLCDAIALLTDPDPHQRYGVLVPTRTPGTGRGGGSVGSGIGGVPNTKGFDGELQADTLCFASSVLATIVYFVAPSFVRLTGGTQLSMV